MDLHLKYNDRFRVYTNMDKLFIDINGLDYEKGIRVDAYSRSTYIEVREKSGQISTFYFTKKSDKKEFDFGWWADAEVVYSKNNVVINK